MCFRKISFVGMLLSVLVVSGCSVTGAPIVALEDRDQSGQYDGSWAMRVNGSAGKQYVGGRTLNCPAVKDRMFYFKVKDGSAAVSVLGGRNYSKFNVNEKGQFQVRVTTKGNWTSSGGGVSTQSGTILILRGDLDESTGRGEYVIGMEHLQGLGCSYGAKLTNRV